MVVCEKQPGSWWDLEQRARERGRRVGSQWRFQKGPSDWGAGNGLSGQEWIWGGTQAEWVVTQTRAECR